MKCAGIVAATLVLLLGSSAFAQTTVTGDWDVSVTSPQGTNQVKVTLTQDGEKVKGVFKTQMGELPFEGTLTGSELKFKYTLPFQGQMLDITMTGKVDGASIAGTADFGGMAEGQWTAKRAAETTAAAASAPAAAPAAAPASAPGGSAGLGGQWDLAFKTPQGEFPATAKFIDEGGKISGSMTSQIGESPVTGTFDGNAIKLALTTQTPQGSMNVTLTGELQGNEIVNGKADITGMGIMDFSAKRKP